MKASIYFSIACGLLLVGCGDGGSGKPAQTTNAASGGSGPLSAPADYVGALGNSKQKAIKTTDTASVDQAIQMFGADKGRNPTDLNELITEKYLPKLPAPPSGMKYEYDAAAGKVSLVPQ